MDPVNGLYQSLTLVFSADQEFLLCATHGARYYPEFSAVDSIR